MELGNHASVEPIAIGVALVHSYMWWSRRPSYRRVWMPALRLLGLLGIHIQDLRHTGNQFTSDAGASLREMMARMGHDSARAALIYQHSTTERQRAIASQVSTNARVLLGEDGQSGTRMARGGEGE